MLFGDSQVRTGYLIVEAMRTSGLRNAFFSMSKEFEKIKTETLTDRFDEVVADSPESQMGAHDGFQVAKLVAKQWDDLVTTGLILKSPVNPLNTLSNVKGAAPAGAGWVWRPKPGGGGKQLFATDATGTALYPE